MKLHLKLKNFQLISDADLEFETGINLITGSNSSGKTAILRALNAILTNPSYAKRYIKHGESSTTVSLQLPEYSQDIEWVRKESGVKYTINGSENVKCGRNTLFDFNEDMPFIYDKDLNKVLNIQTEHDGLFPFNRSNTDMFRLFEDIFQISDSSTIITSIKKDEQETNKSVYNLKLKEKEIENKLQYLTDFNSKYSYQDIDDFKIQCESVLSSLISLDKDFKTTNILLNELKSIIVPEKTEYDFSIVSQYLDINDKYSTAKSLNTFINSMTLNIQEIDLTICESLFEIDKDLKTCMELEMIQDIPQTQIFDWSVFDDFLVIDYGEVEGLAIKLKDLKSQIDTLKIDKQNILSELSIISVCPLCSQEIPSSHQH